MAADGLDCGVDKSQRKKLEVFQEEGNVSGFCITIHTLSACLFSMMGFFFVVQADIIMYYY